MSDEIDPVMVIMQFNTSQSEGLADVLGQYVVLARGLASCRNIDLVHSATRPGRFVIVEKWDSASAQKEHFESDAMAAMASAAVPLLSEQPDIDIYDGLSMHDLA